jgi:LacI family transcriptional regulator
LPESFSSRAWSSPKGKEELATIKDVAAATGLSIATISKYLNGGNVLLKNRRAIERAIKRLGYRRNQMARGLKTKRSMAVGVVIPKFTALFFTEITAILEDRLQAEGYTTVLCDYRDDAEVFSQKLEFLMDRRVDGLAVVCNELGERNLQQFISQKIPVVAFDRRLKSACADTVIVDNAGASRSAVDHLVHSGHKRIGVIAGPRGAFTSQGRLAGFRSAMARHGLKPRKEHVRRGDYKAKSGHDQVLELLKTDVSAIYVTNYEMTLGAMIGLHEQHVRIPEELSMVGFDSLELSHLVSPTLTIVDQPRLEIANRAADLLLRRMRGDWSGYPSLESLSTTLCAGASVARPNR